MEFIFNKYFQIIWETLVIDLSSEGEKHDEMKDIWLNQAPTIAQAGDGA